MDHMTETHVLARTGDTVRTHQQRTVANYLRLRELAPELPIIPVLQGQSITDYHQCADLYEQHGVDLAALPLVGVGSVCRRQHTAEVDHIVRSLAARQYRLHTFGARRSSAWPAMPTRSPPATPSPGASGADMYPAALPATAANPTASTSPWPGTQDFSPPSRRPQRNTASTPSPGNR